MTGLPGAEARDRRVELPGARESELNVKTLMLVFLVGILALLALKVVGAILIAMLPFVVVLGILALPLVLLAAPLGFVVLVGWGVMALFGSPDRTTA